jgi:hypothetical protein
LIVKRLLFVLLLAVTPGVGRADPLSLLIRGHQVSQPVFSLFAAPGEEIRVGVPGLDARSVDLQSVEGVSVLPGADYWLIQAPRKPGLYTMSLSSDPAQQTTLNLFVGHPASHADDGVLNDYLIGPQPPGHATYPDFYTPPELYFEVTPDILDTPLSPNFTLRQFLCKQDSGYPKYLVIRESLLVLLEGLLQSVRNAGYSVDTFGVISGYRTPHYNKMIGNVPNSRHVYGDAMDLYVDQDGDGNMDDLNGDGERDRKDVDLLYEIVQEFKQNSANLLLVGGVGRYYRASHHGGFVHVDARGFRARW